MAVCYVCRNKTSKMCDACQKVYYCSKACQKKDWKEGGHKQTCGGSELSPREVKTIAKTPQIKSKFELTTFEEIDVAGFEAILRIKFDDLAKTNMEELRAIKKERINLKNQILRHVWPTKEQVINWIKGGNVDKIPDHVMFVGSFGSSIEQIQLYNHDLFMELHDCLTIADDLVKVDGRIRRLAWQFKKHGEVVNSPDGIFFIPIAMLNSVENIPIMGPVRRKSAFRSLLFHYLILKHFSIDRFLRKTYVRSLEREEYGKAIVHENYNPNQILDDKLTLTTMIDHAWNNVGEWVQMPRI